MTPNVIFKAGGSFVKLLPQFSSNGENLYVAWKNEIRGYNVKTGALFAQFKGIKGTIVGFGVHYYDSHECVTACSHLGEIITWKIVTFFKMINKKLDKGSIETFHVISSEDGVKALISYKEIQRSGIFIYDLKRDQSEECYFKINASTYEIDVCSDKYFAIVYKNSLNIIPFRDLLKVYTYCNNSSLQFTCLKCHPENEIILTGDSRGRVIMWQNIFTSKPTKAIFHWHTLPVKCLAFSTIGSYFYSGGNESVLVQWQADNHYERKFLPRLPSTIAHISVSPNNIFVAIATNDNGIKIVDSRFDTISTIQNLVIGNSYESGIVIDPRTKALVMNGNFGQIQFYSPFDNCLLYNVDVVGQNKITNERNCNIENTQVSKVAISKTGLWLATVELRRDLEYPPDLRLKFWNFDTSLQNFKLNTSIEDPHEAEVLSLAFQPVASELKLVTIGADKKFKVWYLTETETTDFKVTKIWNCLCVGFYHDLRCRDVSFSIDGSLVAVSFESIVTTWLPDSCKLKCSLSHSVCTEEITQIEFGSGNQCHLLAAASIDRLSVWNLLTLTMIWTVPINISMLIADTVTTNLAIITQENLIYIFSLNSPEFIYSDDKLLKDHKDIYAAAFVPSKHSNDNKLLWYQRSQIFFLDYTKELYCIGSEEEESDTSSGIHEMNKSLFSMTIAQNQNDKNGAIQPVEHLYKKDVTQKTFKQYLDAPIHTMIPIRIMCAPILQSMLLEKSS